VLDHNPAHVDTVQFLEQVREADLCSHIVVISDVTEYHTVHRIMEAGASGYLGKSVPLSMLVAAIKSVAAGNRFLDPLLVATYISPDQKCLSAREVEVLQLVGNGWSNKMIAYELDVGESTIKSHIRSSMQKLKADSRSAAVAVALRASLIS